MSVRSLVRPLSKRLDRLRQRVVHFGLSRYCPVCRSRLRHFLPYGVVPRPHARCPVCGALERHRLLWLFFTTQTDLMQPTPKRMLHVAPERAFTTQLRRIPGLDYLTADLYNPRAMVKMDVTNIQYPDNSFDVIYCSHVLEHVPDDRKAMREFFRVLKPTGWAVLEVPITADHTIEDPSVVDPEERERLFGQKDHVRRYGPDYTQRLAEAGFSVRCIPATDVADQRQRRVLGIPEGESIYYCTRAA